MISRFLLLHQGCGQICPKNVKRHCVSRQLSLLRLPRHFSAAFVKDIRDAGLRKHFAPLSVRTHATKGEIFESFEDFDAPEEPEAAVLLVACAIGLFTGGSVVAFNWLIHQIQDFSFVLFPLSEDPRSRGLPRIETWPLFIAAPALGALGVGAIRRCMDSLEVQEKLLAGVPGFVSQLKYRCTATALPLLKATAAAVTLGSGNSLGPEGPSVDLGRSSARGFGALLRSKDKHITALLAAGSAAGVAAGFNAPISGVFFAIETVLAKRRSLDEEEDDSGLTIAMLLLAAVLAATVSRAGLGSSPAFSVPAYQLVSVYELPLYAGLGAVCGTLASVFIYWSKACSRLFDNIREDAEPVEVMLLPVVGGLTTGVLGLAYPEIMYQGFENVNKLLKLNGEYGIFLLCQIVAVKLVATGVSKASGLVGGLYAPSIFLGAALGSAFADMGHLVVDQIPGIDIAPAQAYALVGVAAMLASVCQVPLTSILLLFELTQDYTIIVPTLGAVGLSYWLGLLLRKTVIDGLPLPPSTKSTTGRDSGEAAENRVPPAPLAYGSPMGGGALAAQTNQILPLGLAPGTPAGPMVDPQLDSGLRQVYLSYRPSGDLLNFPWGEASLPTQQTSLGAAVFDGGQSSIAAGSNFVVLSVGMAVETAVGQLVDDGTVGLVYAADGQLVAVVNRQMLLDSAAVVGAAPVGVDS